MWVAETCQATAHCRGSSLVAEGHSTMSVIVPLAWGSGVIVPVAAEGAAARTTVDALTLPSGDCLPRAYRAGGEGVW